MNPITTVMVNAAVQGAVAGLKPTSEKAIKDAYNAFKQIIINRYNNHKDLIVAVETLDKQPEDVNQQIIVENELVKAGAIKDSVLLEAANDIFIAGAVRNSKKEVLGKRLQRKLKQVTALENQFDLTLDDGQKIILEEKARNLWKDIELIEEQILQMQ